MTAGICSVRELRGCQRRSPAMISALRAARCRPDRAGAPRRLHHALGLDGVGELGSVSAMSRRGDTGRGERRLRELVRGAQRLGFAAPPAVAARSRAEKVRQAAAVGFLCIIFAGPRPTPVPCPSRRLVPVLGVRAVTTAGARSLPSWGSPGAAISVGCRAGLSRSRARAASARLAPDHLARERDTRGAAPFGHVTAPAARKGLARRILRGITVRNTT